jgi:FMN-dependent NADH-azoreductase
MNVLHLDCSPRTSGSQSRRLSAAVVRRLLDGHPGAVVTARDLGGEPLPHVDGRFAAALASPAARQSAEAAGAMGLSDVLIEELEHADIVVVGSPVNNFTVPSSLKAWLDHVVRVGRTFMPTPTGKVGLLKDRPVFVATASGGFFAGDRATQPDFLTPYLSAIFGCIGLTSLTFLPLQGTAFLDPPALAAQQDALLRIVDRQDAAMACC